MNWQIKTRVWGRTIPKSGWRIRGGQINRIYYVHSGKVNIEIDHKPTQLLPGHLYLLPESVSFTACMSDDDPLDHTYFDFDAIPCFLFQGVLEIAVADHPLIQKWLDLAEEIFRTYFGQHWEPEVLDVVNSSLQNLLFILSQTAELPVMNDPRILDTMLYIQDHLEEPLSVETLAARLFLDKHYFTRLFSHNTGQPPHRYIQNKRLNRSVFLLQKGLTGKEIAEACGFGSYSAFARAFRACYHCPPTRYLEIRNAASGCLPDAVSLRCNRCFPHDKNAEENCG